MPKTKKVNKKAVVPEIKPVFKSALKIAGKWYRAEGSTIQEAIQNLKVERPRGMGVLLLEKGDKKKERIIVQKTLNNIFGKVSRLSNEIALKQTSLLFNIF